jgi:protein TonB
MNQASVGYLSLLGSVALHGFAVTQSTTEASNRSPLMRPPTFVELTKLEPPPEPPSVSPPPAPEPEPRPAPEPEPRLPPERPRPSPPIEQPVSEPAKAPSEAPPPELTGVTLTGGDGASFGTPEGNGAPRENAITVGAGRAVPAKVARRAEPPAPLPALPLSQLSQRPVPPPLEAALERNYPRQARQLGKSGEAKVRARIEPSGEIHVASVVSATSPDFGEACRRTLMGSRWSAPLDENGRRAATSVYYRCKFRID